MCEMNDGCGCCCEQIELTIDFWWEEVAKKSFALDHRSLIFLTENSKSSAMATQSCMQWNFGIINHHDKYKPCAETYMSIFMCEFQVQDITKL